MQELTADMMDMKEEELPAAGSETVVDPDRLAALRATRLLDSPPEDAFDRLTELVRLLLGVPVSLVSLVDYDRQFFKSSQGLPEPWCTMRQTPLSHSFCQHVVTTASPLVIDDSRDNALVKDNLAIRDLNVIAYLGIPLRAPSGHVIGSLCAIDGEPRAWSDGDVGMLAGLAELVMTEITLQHELRLRADAQESLTEKARLLEEANKSKDRFYSILAHDLRNPISTLLMLSETLARDFDSMDVPVLRDFVQQLHTSADHLNTLLDNLLTWSLLQKGGMRYTPQWFDLDRQARQLAELVGTPSREKGISVDVDMSAGLHAWADPDMIRSTLLNLLTNAVKFTNADGKVEIRATSTLGHLLVEVRDTGVGMTEEQLADLFRLGNTTTTRGTADEPGTGLGLQLCKEMLALHGTALTVVSKPGEGSTFSFLLPAARPTDSLETTTSESPS